MQAAAFYRQYQHSSSFVLILISIANILIGSSHAAYELVIADHCSASRATLLESAANGALLSRFSINLGEARQRRFFVEKSLQGGFRAFLHLAIAAQHLALASIALQ